MWSFFSRDAAKDFDYGLQEDDGYLLQNFFIWKIYSGYKKSTSEPVSIFVCENTSPDTQTVFDICKASLKRLKTLKHPSFLTYIDSLETDKLLYLVVEPVRPLMVAIIGNDYTTDQANLAISWGLHQIASGINFLNSDCHLVHNNICITSVFVDKAGEWKLFGLEYITPDTELYPVKILPSQQSYTPPEISNSKNTKQPSNWACDSWGLGCLIYESFTGLVLKHPSNLNETYRIHNSIIPLYGELLSAKPESRPNASKFLKKATTSEGFLNNKFVECMLFLREIHIKENEEILTFFNNLSSSLDSFPQDICLNKVLPELINAYEFGNAGSSVLTPMLKLGKLLPEKEYQKKIVPHLVKMFSSKDRATRAKLLQQVEHFVDYIQPSVINNQIFPNIAQGFVDTNPTIRDQTIKCMLYLASKLNYHNLNEEMLKHFARLQSKDEQGGIRTNTTVCLGKIASYLHPQTRKKVLINAFLRALRDPFPPARAAAILALSASEHYYSIQDCATKVLPALCHFTVDPEKDIRDQAFKAIKGFLTKLQKVSEDPSLAEKMEEELQSTTPASIAATWTSWAVTSLADKLYKSSSKASSPAPSQATTPASESVVQQKTETEERTEKASKSNNIKENSWDDWNNEEKIEKSEAKSLPSPSENSPTAEGWEEDWEDLEAVVSLTKNTQKLKSYFPGESEDPFSSFESKPPVPEETTPTPDSGDWDTDNWDTWESDKTTKIVPERSTESLQQKKEANRIAREERRRQKLKERQLAKPTKLGAQKIS